MQVDKSQVLDFLRSRGDEGKVQQAQDRLPDKVDTDKDSGLLGEFGVDPEDLTTGLGGEGGNKIGL